MYLINYRQLISCYSTEVLYEAVHLVIGRLVIDTLKGFYYCIASNPVGGQNGGPAEFSTRSFLSSCRIAVTRGRALLMLSPETSFLLPALEHCTVAQVLPARSTEIFLLRKSVRTACQESLRSPRQGSIDDLKKDNHPSPKRSCLAPAC